MVGYFTFPEGPDNRLAQVQAGGYNKVMNPNSGEGAPQSQPSFELPVQPENQPATGEIQSDKALERSSAAETAVGKQQPPPTMSPAQAVALPSNQVQVGDDDDDVTATPHQISDHQAKDSDFIEKIWINKAKSIIAQTSDDPFVQKNEMSKVKADYIQKRFNKTIPLDNATGK